MIYVILLLEIFLFGLVFFRLVTTNHWTLGKKLLVGLVAGILIECSGFIAAMILSLDPIALIFIKVPKVMASGLMVCFFYKNEIDH